MHHACRKKSPSFSNLQGSVRPWPYLLITKTKRKETASFQKSARTRLFINTKQVTCSAVHTGRKLTSGLFHNNSSVMPVSPLHAQG